MGVVLVCGPACGGKSTWVQSQLAEGDTVVDFDDIVEEIGAERYSPTPEQTARARATWQHRVKSWRGPGICWVIWASPSRQQRGIFRDKHKARVIVVRADMDVCLARAEGTRPPAWQGLIRSWFQMWEPSRSTFEAVVDTSNLAMADPRT